MMRRLFLHSPKHYIAAAVIATAFAVLAFYIRWQFVFGLYAIGDSLSIGGAVTFLLGMLSLVSYFGAFDGFNFAFRGGRKYGPNTDYYEFMERKKEERRREDYTFMPYLAVGFVFLIIGIILFNL